MMFKALETTAGAINVATYTFHDPAIEGTKRVRATMVGLLTEGGELFGGIAVCSEKDQFVKADGRVKALAEAISKAEKWLKGRAMPDAVLPVLLGPENSKELFHAVRISLELMKAECFREMLAERAAYYAARIDGYLDEMDKLVYGRLNGINDKY